MEKIPFEKDKTDESVGFNLWQTYNIWHKLINQKLSALDLTHVQFVLLSATGWLSNNERDVTQVQLAHFAKVDVMMTSTVLRTLETKELIKRFEHKVDTRAKCVTITEKGQKKLVAALEIVECADAEFFKILGTEFIPFNKALLTLKDTKL